MKYEVYLDEQDYLIHQLYAASRRAGTKKRMNRGRWIMLVSFLALAVVGHLQGSEAYSTYFAIAGLALFIIYPLYFKWVFKRHYKKWVKQNFSNRFDEPVVMEFFEDHIYSKDKTGDGNINISEITSVEEIEDYYFLLLSNGNSFIIPKNKVAPEVGITDEIERIWQRDGVEHHIDLDWKW